MATKVIRAVTNCLETCLGLGLYRFRQRAFYGPAFEKSFAQATGSYSKFDSQVFHAHRLSLKRQQDGRSLVASLLSWRCPFAVFWVIAQRAIFSFNAVRCGWLRSHIGVKVLKRFPSLAYGDPASSIVRKFFSIWVIASFLHCIPRAVFWRVGHAVCSFASARFATTTAVRIQLVCTDRAFCSALAEADPEDSPRLAACISAENRPFPELLSGQVFEAVVATSRIAVSHVNLLNRFNVVRTATQLQLIGCSHFSTLAIRGQI